MGTLTKHDRRLLAGAIGFLLTIIGADKAGVEIIAEMSKKDADLRSGIGATLALMAVCEPDSKPSDVAKASADTFRNNLERLAWLGRGLLEDGAELGIRTEGL